MKILFRPEPLNEDEKRILRAQYQTLFILVDEICQANGRTNHLKNFIWYQICSTPKNYESIKEIIHVAFCFLVRDQNECSVEALIGDVQDVDSSN